MRRAALVAIGTALLIGCGPSALAGPPRGQFVTRCEYSHSLPDDPIVHPNMPGMSHRHDFFGSTETSATATVTDLTRGPTTCRLRGDTAAYWFPTAYVGERILVPTFAKAYYFGLPLREVEVPPLGLQLIAGDPEADSPEVNPHATWSCGASGTHRTPIADHPYDCTAYAERWDFVDSVVARLQFPSCWDGRGLGQDALRYAVDRRCPEGFQTRLPTFRTQIHYGILDPCPGDEECRPDDPGDAVGIHLASGPYYTLHADFWNTWRPEVLEGLIRRCLNHHRSCGMVVDPSRVAGLARFRR